MKCVLVLGLRCWWVKYIHISFKKPASSTILYNIRFLCIWVS